MSSNELNVHIGQVKIGKRDDALHALLGSCVGIALLWPQKRLYGLAHCLLSESPEKSSEINGRYVDQAIPSLISLMNIRNVDLHEIQAVVAGGGNMTMPDTTKPEKLVGTINVNAALKYLDKLSVNVIHQETGGVEGRKISIDCSSGEFEIKTFRRIVAL